MRSASFSWGIMESGCEWVRVGASGDEKNGAGVLSLVGMGEVGVIVW